MNKTNKPNPALVPNPTAIPISIASGRAGKKDKAYEQARNNKSTTNNTGTSADMPKVSLTAPKRKVMSPAAVNTAPTLRETNPGLQQKLPASGSNVAALERGKMVHGFKGNKANRGFHASESSHLSGDIQATNSSKYIGKKPMSKGQKPAALTQQDVPLASGEVKNLKPAIVSKAVANLNMSIKPPREVTQKKNKKNK